MLVKRQKKRRFYYLLRRAKSKKGEGYIDVVVLTIAAMLVLCTILAVLPVFIAKMNLDTYANELAREAEISGRVGAETNQRLNRLNEIKNLNPNVAWDRTGRIHIGQDVTVTVTTVVDIGFFTFVSIPITLTSTATGTSEVLWK
ncbi:MAG: DUF4320 family protein [Oscillospiraceae bacterium]|jgi:hypothetical protein|nr:DUF4320 family protein [Oscillospiraceae bacterium]